MGNWTTHLVLFAFCLLGSIAAACQISTEPATSTDTPSASVVARLAPTEQGPPTVTTPTGIASIDAAIAAIEAGDMDALGLLVRYTRQPCVTPEDVEQLDLRPLCDPGQSTGDLADGFAVANCEGGTYSRGQSEKIRQALESILSGSLRFYGAFSTTPDVWGAGKYIAVFYGPAGQSGLARVAMLDDAGVVGAATGCGSTPEQLAASSTARGSALPNKRATAIVADASSTPVLSPLPTAASASESMYLSGSIWVDAKPATGEVLAYINGQQCGKHGQSFTSVDAGGPTFVVEILSDAEMPGCGVPGEPVVITINGRAINEVIEWQPGAQQPRKLVAGPPFGTYMGEFRINSFPQPFDVVAYVDGTECGRSTARIIQLSPADPPKDLPYGVVVNPDELQSGCGRAGTTVILQIEFEGPAGAVREAIYQGSWDTQPVHLPPMDLPSYVPTKPFSTLTDH